MEKKHKGGRRRLPDEKKVRGMEVQLSPDDIELLTNEAQRLGMNRSAYVRGIMETELKKIRERRKPRVKYFTRHMRTTIVVENYRYDKRAENALNIIGTRFIRGTLFSLTADYLFCYRLIPAIQDAPSLFHGNLRRRPGEYFRDGCIVRDQNRLLWIDRERLIVSAQWAIDLRFLIGKNLFEENPLDDERIRQALRALGGTLRIVKNGPSRYAGGPEKTENAPR